MYRTISRCMLMIAALGLLSLTYRPAVGETAQDELDLTTQGYLPLIIRPLLAEITFGTTTDEQGRPDPPQTTIGHGERRLYYNISVEGGVGRSYRTEFILPGGPIPPDIGTLPSNDFDAPGVICYTDPNLADCNDPTGALVPGTYRIRLFVDDQFVAEESATVLAGLDEPRNTGATLRLVPATSRR